MQAKKESEKNLHHLKLYPQRFRLPL